MGGVEGGERAVRWEGLVGVKLLMVGVVGMVVVVGVVVAHLQPQVVEGGVAQARPQHVHPKHATRVRNEFFFGEQLW